MSGGGGGVGDNNKNEDENVDDVDDYGGGARGRKGEQNKTKPPDFGFKMNCSRGSWQLEFFSCEMHTVLWEHPQYHCQSWHICLPFRISQ